MKNLSACLILLASLSVFAWDGGHGQNGQSISITADGTNQSYNISGGNGGNGTPGRDGRDAHCMPIGGPSNVSQHSGESGERGGNGGDGGNAGNLVVYYQDIANLKNIQVYAVPGAGGYGAYGGRGGRGCQCSYTTWKIEDQTYYCTSGHDGMSGYNGSRGSNGSWGEIQIINSPTPLKPSVTARYVEMSTMESKPGQVSKNHWETRRGAASLFAPGSRMADSYFFFLGRTEVNYAFKWAASRPVSEFKNWQMYVYLDGEEAKVNFPSNLIVKKSTAMVDGVQVITIEAVVKTTEVFNLRLEEMAGKEADAKLVLSDLSKVSDLVGTSASLNYMTYENGSYKSRFKDVLPAEALEIRKEGFDVKLGGLGIDPKYLAGGTKVFVALTVKREFEGRTVTRVFNQYFTIRLINEGTLIEILADSNLYTGNQVVGKVLKGEQYTVSKIQNGWVSLKKDDGTVLPGWIQMQKIKVAT